MENPGPKTRAHLFGYLDETGLLHSPATDRFFGLGVVMIQNPRHLHRSIIRLKSKRKFHQEFKFKSVDHQTLPIYKELIDIAFEESRLRFLARIVDKTKKKHQDKYKAYNKYTGQLIADGISATNDKVSEYITILADDVSTSDKDDKFEQDVRARIRQVHRRNALYGICRLESHAVSEIQLADVLIGAVAYAFKMKEDLVPKNSAKAQLVKYIQTKMNVYALADEHELRLKNGVFIKISTK